MIRVTIRALVELISLTLFLSTIAVWAAILIQ